MDPSDPTESTPVSESGDVVRARRERLGASQEEVAEAAGVNRDTVSAVEHDKSSGRTRRLVLEALTQMEEEAGFPPYGQPLVRRVEPVEGAPALIRVIVPGVYGADSIVVEGPVDDPEGLAAAVDAIMRRRYPPSPPEA